MLCSAFLMLAGWGCTPLENTQTVLELSPEVVQVDHKAQTEVVGVDASGPWTATSSVEWLTLLNAEGNGNDIIEFEVEANPEVELRVAEITVTMGNLVASALVEQSAASFRVSETTVALAPENATAEVKVYSTSPWTANSSAKWLSVAYDDSNEAEKTLTITAEDNSTIEERTAEIVVKTIDEQAVIKVTQSTFESDTFLVLVDSEEYDRATTTLTPDIFGTTYTVSVGTPQGGVVWDAKTDSHFITLSNNLSNTGNGSFTITVPFNNEGVRSGVVTLKGKAGNKTYELPITVNQSFLTAEYTETITPKAIGDTINMNLTVAPELAVKYQTEAEWISVDQEGTIIIADNPELATKRTGTVTAVLAKDTNVVVATSTIMQDPLYSITIPLQCNTYVTPLDPTLKAEPSFASSVLPGAGGISGDNAEKTGGRMGTRSWRKVHISSQPHQLSFFFRTETTGPINFGMETLLERNDSSIPDTAWLEIEINDVRKRMMITNNKLYWAYMGTFNITEPGYVRVNIIPIDATGRYLPYIKNFRLGGEGIRNTTKKSNILSFVDENNIKSSDPHWIMRGPSGNLSYPQPANTEYFYNEIYVDKGYDFSGGYYMTTGGSAFYMGMQPNDNGRTILFSAWDTDTDKGWHAEVVRYGATKPNSFGHEGSGKQTFLKYEWKAETTYATMAHVRPEVDENGNQTGATLYTGYFWSEDDIDRNDINCYKGWHLVAEYRRPNEVAYYRGAHSFCENFSPYRGWIPRRVNFTNQWMIDKDGVWHEVTTAYLGVDGTGSSGMRKDFSGGVDERGFFYLTNIGYINEYGKPGTAYRREPKGNKPEIPFEELEKLGTWVE